MSSLKRDYHMGCLANLLVFLSETTGSNDPSEAHVGLLTRKLYCWCTDRSVNSSAYGIVVPPAFFTQAFLTKGPCPLTGKMTAHALELAPALAWLVAEGFISAEESQWVETTITLRLMSPS